MVRSFQHSLRLGRNGETQLENLLQNAGFTTNNVGKTNPYWDIEVSGHELDFKVEVKFDLYEARSGNIAVELFNTKRGQPSGLTATKADLWCFVLTQEIWLTTVKALSAYCDGVTPDRVIESGGDNNARLYLYDRNAILPTIFTRIDKLSAEELVKVCRKFMK